MIICIRDVSLLNQRRASVRQLAGGALIGLKAHLVWFILNILCASQTLLCKGKDIKWPCLLPPSGLSESPQHFHLASSFVQPPILPSAVSIFY